MSIETTVTSALSQFQSYASSAVTTANNAIDAIKTQDFGFTFSPGLTHPDLYKTGPADPARPGRVAISEAPAVEIISIPSVPTEPIYASPDLPALLSLTIPDVPDVTFPSLDIEAPSYSIPDAPSFTFSISDILISDDPLMQAAIDRLKNNIVYGGTGLTEAVENAIWARDLERMEQQLEDATDKVMAMWAKKGFSLPDGMLAHSLSEVQKEHYNKLTDRSREISIKQAELEQTNIFKSLELAVSLAGQLSDMLIKYETLALQAQEMTAKFANEYIDMQIKTYGIALEGFKAAAAVYEAKIRAMTSQVEIYKTQVEAEVAKNQVNESSVKLYSEQMRAITVLVDIYKAKVQAMAALLEGEKVKVEANKMQFDVWAKETETRIAIFNGQVEQYRAETQFNVAEAEAYNRWAESAAKLTLADSELLLKQAEMELNALQFKQKMQVAAQESIAQAAGTLAAGAMAAAHASASMSYSETAE
jgi:hypothetical protein